MNKLVLIVTVVSIGGAASVARHPPGTSAPAATQRYSSPNPWSKDEILAEQPQRAVAHAAQAAQPGVSGGEVRLEREADGHFYADAMMRGVAVRAVVDTGASVVALPGAEARRIGLAWNADEVRPVGRGASGTVFGLVRKVESITVGSLVVRDIEVMIVPEGLDVTLLGQNFLSEIRKVEMRGDEMVLSNL